MKFIRVGHTLQDYEVQQIWDDAIDGETQQKMPDLGILQFFLSNDEPQSFDTIWESVKEYNRQWYPEGFTANKYFAAYSLVRAIEWGMVQIVPYPLDDVLRVGYVVRVQSGNTDDDKMYHIKSIIDDDHIVVSWWDYKEHQKAYSIKPRQWFVDMHEKGALFLMQGITIDDFPNGVAPKHMELVEDFHYD